MPKLSEPRIVADTTDTGEILHALVRELNVTSLGLSYGNNKGLRPFFRRYVNHFALADLATTNRVNKDTLPDLADNLVREREALTQEALSYLNRRAPPGLRFLQEPGTNRWGWFKEVAADA